MRLGPLLAAAAELGAEPFTAPTSAAEGLEVNGVTHRTDAVGAGWLYCCVPGATVDGHNLAPAALAAGAVALVVERPLGLGAPEVRVRSTRRVLGPLSAAFWGEPSKDMRVVGITGTAGKTTTAHLIGAVLEAHGWSTAVLGSLSGERTTPEAPDLQARLAAERDAGRLAVAMEVSSHALALDRVRSMRFALGVFTNLGHDHLDFHADLDDYFEAKARLFTPELTERAVVNLDDPRGRELARRAVVPTVGFSMDDVDGLEIGAGSSRFRWRGQEVLLPLGGRFNVANALAAATAAGELGVPPTSIAAGLASAPPVPGRWQAVSVGQPFAVLVDYSHKPEALAQALGAAREVAGDRGAVSVVFGAGGERDRAKRPAMGAVAARLADHVWLTTDNPRHEDPADIAAEVAAGIPEGADLQVELDRATAIGAAVARARPGDVVVIAGRGHETVQDRGETSIALDDRDVALDALRRRARSGSW